MSGVTASDISIYIICLSWFRVFSTLRRIKSKPLEITTSNFQKMFIMIICRHYALMTSLFITGHPQTCLGMPKLARNQVLAIVLPFVTEFVSKRHSVFISMILSLYQNMKYIGHFVLQIFSTENFGKTGISGPGGHILFFCWNFHFEL